MATSITQAKPLLTAAELELFDHSRAEPIKQFSAKQLAGKEKRARTLRDKYRDLYRRQTVALRGKAKGGAPSAPDANVRTQRKADIMQEVLERFEARSSLLAVRAERQAPSATASAPRRKAAPAGGKTAKAAPKAAARAPAKKAKPSSKSGTAASKSPAKAAPAPRSPRAGASLAAAPAKAKVRRGEQGVAASQPGQAGKRANSEKSPFPTSANPPKARKPKVAEPTLSAVAVLQQAAQDAPRIDHFTGKDPTPRSDKAPSERAPTHGGKANAPDINAPLDMVAAAQRVNPVRAMPGNIAIQGHVSSNVRRAQGKRDSR
jgi:hypothetical protein